MKLSVDFAFAGIRIITKNPAAVLLWSLLATVVSLVTTVVMVAMAGPALTALQTYEPAQDGDPAQLMTHFAELAPVWAIALVVAILSASIIQCAVFRSQLRPQEGGIGFMKLGGDEVRQFIVFILYILAFIVFYILFAIVAGILIGIAAGVMAVNAIAGGILIGVAIVTEFVAFLYITSRWSLVLVQSYDERKINIFGSLKLTKGNGWALFGGYFLLGIVMMIAMIVIYGIMFGVTMGVTLGNGDLASVFQQMTQPNMSSVSALFTPVFIIQTLVGGLLSGAFYAMIHGATVSAYQTLMAKNASKADLF